MVTPRRFELIAPSGHPVDPQTVARALGRLAAAGHEVSGAAVAERRLQRFAGTDSTRAADLNRLADPARPLPDVVLAVRGGYGATRILSELDYDGLRRRLSGAPVALVGHSDFTVIQLALLAKAGLITFGGPMLCSDFGATTLNPFAMASFWNTLGAPEASVRSAEPQPYTLDVRGTLWGGNLAMLTSLLDTPYLPRIDGGILFVEDINEPSFRIERMLYQLHLSGVLARQHALVLGAFSGIKQTAYDDGYDLAAVVEQVRAVSGIPVITGLPFGHIEDLATLPVGAPARLVASQSGFELSFSGYPHFA